MVMAVIFYILSAIFFFAFADSGIVAPVYILASSSCLFFGYACQKLNEISSALKSKSGLR